MSTLKVNAITETDGSAFPFGKILQAEQEVKTGLSSTTSLSFIDLLSVSVTPSSTSSKFLLMYKVPMSVAVNGYSGMLRLSRNSTAIYIGDAYNSNIRASSQAIGTTSNGSYRAYDLNGVFIDSPSTTSAITYKVQFKNDYSGYTVYVGRNLQGSTEALYATYPHSLVVMEIG